MKTTKNLDERRHSRIKRKLRCLQFPTLSTAVNISSSPSLPFLTPTPRSSNSQLIQTLYMLSTGYYLYLEASGQRFGDRAQLASPVLQGSCTVRLYYHMMGTHVNALNVYRQMAIRGPLVLLSNVSGQAGDNWIRWNIPLSSTVVKPYRLIIEGSANAPFTIACYANLPSIVCAGSSGYIFIIVP